MRAQRTFVCVYVKCECRLHIYRAAGYLRIAEVETPGHVVASARAPAQGLFLGGRDIAIVKRHMSIPQSAFILRPVRI